MQKRLTPSESAILLALARYKYLTVSQMVALGIATKKANISRSVKGLLDPARPLVERNTFWFHPKKGRLEDIYYLNKHGVTLLLEAGALEEDEILYPKGRSTHFTQDYFHRKYTIDFQIAISNAAALEGMDIAFFDRYFDKEGSNRKGDGVSTAKMVIGKNAYLIPDAVFLLEREQDRHFYCAEIYNGKDTKRVVTQLAKHVRALETGSPSIKYGIDKGNRVLCLFEHPSIQEAVIKRLKSDEFFANVTDYLLFKHLEEIIPSPFENWLNLDGNLVRML